VQKDRIEFEIVGWGVGRESWSIDKDVLLGNPEFQQVWDDLEARLTQRYDGAGRTFRISCVGIDSGYHTNQVMAFCRAARAKGRNWFPLKGLSTPGNAIVRRGTKDAHHKIHVWNVGTDTAKDEVFAFLRVEAPGPGFCHFPANDERYDDAYIRQLCSEKKCRVSKWAANITSTKRSVPASATRPSTSASMRPPPVRSSCRVSTPGPNAKQKRRTTSAKNRRVSTIRRQRMGQFDEPEPVQKDVENTPKPAKKSRVRVKNNGFGGYNPSSW
jgi:hypothetical protein